MINKISGIERAMLDFFIRFEKRSKRRKVKSEAILPKYVIKRSIIIKCNGMTVFDNDRGNKMVPKDIQYAIKRYGYPSTIKSTNNTPLIYEIDSSAGNFSLIHEKGNS